MRCIPVHTKKLLPPQDSLTAALEASELEVQEGDVVCISSKVVAIHEGRCATFVDKEERQKAIRGSATATIARPYATTPLTVINHAFISGAGFDTSNGNGYTIMLPEDPFASAKYWWEWFRETHQLTNVGVVLTDSRSLPLRYGATGVTIGWWGIEPLQSHIGNEDLFARAFKYERSNVVDGIAAAATVVMGETNEQTPVALVRDVPKLHFTDTNTKDDIFCAPGDDSFRVLYENK